MSRLPLALSADHSQDNDPKEPPKREEDTLTKHNLGGFPRTRGDGPRRVTIVIDNSTYRSNNTHRPEGSRQRRSPSGSHVPGRAIGVVWLPVSLRRRLKTLNLNGKRGCKRERLVVAFKFCATAEKRRPVFVLEPHDYVQ